MEAAPVSVVDVGSNAIRWSIGRRSAEGQLQLLASGREAVRIGEDVFRSGRISELTVRRMVKAFQLFLNDHAEAGAATVRVVATSALREARNREEVVSQIRKQVGLEIDVISGMEEARLVRTAVETKLDLKHETAILLDVGGGSLELTFCRQGDVVFADSLKAGTVRLLQVLEEAKGNYNLLERFIRQYSYGVVKELRREFQDTPITLFVGTGGNVEALAQLKTTLLGIPDEQLILIEELEEIVAKISSLSVEQRVADLGMRPDRADVVIPAAYVLLSVMRWFSINKMSVPAVGLREGILDELLRRKKNQAFMVEPKELEAYALELGRRFHFSEIHARAVVQHARRLFAATKDLHSLNEEAETLLVLASYLHDIGQIINYSGHHKHSYYIIKSVPFFGLTPRQKQIVAAVTRYHRKASPSLKHEAFQLVPVKDREMVLILAAILRVADAVDRDHEAKVIGLELVIQPKKISLVLEAEVDVAIELWAIRKKQRLFEQVFHRELEATSRLVTRS